MEVGFIRYASFNLHILHLEVCGLFEVDTFFSIRTTPDNMEIGEIRSLAYLAKSSIVTQCFR